MQVNAVLGPATRTHTIYEHIEVVVHPLGVHLTEAVATAFWVSALTALSSANRHSPSYFLARHGVNRCIYEGGLVMSGHVWSGHV